MNGAISGEQLPPTAARKAWTAQRLGERLQMAPHGDANYFENLNFILKEMKPSLLYQSQVIFRLCQRTS